MTAWYLLIGLIVVQRLIELAIARINTRRLLAEGAVEVGASHYPLIVLLHAAWFVSLLVFVPGDSLIDPILLGVFILLQLGRVWVLTSLGRYWTTRIITMPGAPLVRRGPFRLVRHPNYLIVEAEIIVVPMIAGAWELAIIFGIANAAVLALRIRVEEQALKARRA
ncbi:MAG: isoprenylcysteine carboxylmethyltransferase family protein [Proteobacteria bacterium]|nr:isoprenylcysteine carboxylmethyltransferase family protein [Pseudomonadota bacterium]